MFLPEYTSDKAFCIIQNTPRRLWAEALAPADLGKRDVSVLLPRCCVDFCLLCLPCMNALAPQAPRHNSTISALPDSSLNSFYTGSQLVGL